MFLSLFVEIWEHFKDEGYGGQIAVFVSVAILTAFTDFIIFWLWIDQFAWNWWPNWRIFAATADGKYIFYWCDPQFILLTVEAGVKKSFFLNLAILDKKFTHLQYEKWPKIYGQKKLLLKC